MMIGMVGQRQCRTIDFGRTVGQQGVTMMNIRLWLVWSDNGVVGQAIMGECLNIKLTNFIASKGRNVGPPGVVTHRHGRVGIGVVTIWTIIAGLTSICRVLICWGRQTRVYRGITAVIWNDMLLLAKYVPPTYSNSGVINRTWHGRNIVYNTNRLSNSQRWIHV